MSKHTPEPWTAQSQPRLSVIHGPEGEHVADTGCWRDDEHPEMRANAARIVACVNACAGIPTEQLGDVKALVKALESIQHRAEECEKIHKLTPIRSEIGGYARRKNAIAKTIMNCGDEARIALAPFLRKD